MRWLTGCSRRLMQLPVRCARRPVAPTLTPLAAARGVDVRLVVDGIGSYSWLMSRPESMRVQLRVWNPLPWTFASRASLNLRWRWLMSINRRNHRKVTRSPF